MGVTHNSSLYAPIHPAYYLETTVYIHQYVIYLVKHIVYLQPYNVYIQRDHLQ